MLTNAVQVNISCRNFDLHLASALKWDHIANYFVGIICCNLIYRICMRRNETSMTVHMYLHMPDVVIQSCY